MRKVLISTGGTGGHIYPALALANKLKERDVEVVFVGTKYRMEKEIVPKYGFKFIGLSVKPIKSLGAVYKFFKSILKSIKIILEEKPDVVIGFGNYISVSVLIAAILTRKNFYLHEQNVKMGFANKIFYRFSKKTFLAFQKTFENLPIKYHSKLLVTGNPLREEFYRVKKIEEREKLKFEENEKMLLIVGGSLGASSINKEILKNWDKISKEKNIRIYWATGKAHFEEISNQLKRLKKNDIVKPYFENMAYLMSAADLVLCRSGALTVSELMELQKPSIMIPYNFVGQYENAELVKEIGAALIYSNDKLEEAVNKAIEILKGEKTLKEMEDSLRIYKKREASSIIIEELDIWRN